MKRSATHRGDVAHVDGERLPADVGRVDEIEIEMDTLDHGVRGQEQKLAGGPADHGGVIADPGLSIGRLGQEAPHAFDRGELAVAAL